MGMSFQGRNNMRTTQESLAWGHDMKLFLRQLGFWTRRRCFLHKAKAAKVLNRYRQLAAHKLHRIACDLCNCNHLRIVWQSEVQEYVIHIVCMIFRIHLYYMPLVYKEYIQSSQNAVYISIYFNPVSIDSTEKALTAKANSPQIPKRPTRCKHECPHLQSCSSLLSPFRPQNSAHGLSVYHNLSIPLSKTFRASFEGLAKYVWVIKIEAERDRSWRLVQLWFHGISAGCVGTIGRFWPARKHAEGSSTLKYHLPSLPKTKRCKANQKYQKYQQ